MFGLITLLFTKEKSSVSDKKQSINLWQVIKETFDFKTVENKHFWQLLFSRFLFLVGIYGFQSFAQYFIRDKFPEHDPIMFTQVVMGTFVTVLVIFSLVAGALSDKVGRKKLQILSSVIGAIGAGLLIFAVTPAQLLIFGSFMGIGLGIFLSVNWAIANDMAPKAEAAKYMGLTNIATAGSAAVARLEGPVTDILNNAAPGQWWGWTALFAFSGVLMLLSALALLPVPESRKR